MFRKRVTRREFEYPLVITTENKVTTFRVPEESLSGISARQLCEILSTIRGSQPRVYLAWGTNGQSLVQVELWPRTAMEPVSVLLVFGKVGIR